MGLKSPAVMKRPLDDAVGANGSGKSNFFSGETR